ncbi:hypothetical protein BKA83DRAFT_4123039 [Pisolithus microcarpus]|nr:hypothetical protein BKA83DRAFT_4123039 [Pisolithus microcarpus]
MVGDSAEGQLENLHPHCTTLGNLWRISNPITPPPTSFQQPRESTSALLENVQPHFTIWENIQSQLTTWGESPTHHTALENIQVPPWRISNPIAPTGESPTAPWIFSNPIWQPWRISNCPLDNSLTPFGHPGESPTPFDHPGESPSVPLDILQLNLTTLGNLQLPLGELPNHRTHWRFSHPI